MTIILIVAISIVSVLAFRYKKLFLKMDLAPYLIIQKKEYYRVLTHAFLHADYMHLLINMVVLLSFGKSVEGIFKNLEDYEYISSANLHLIVLIFLGIIGSSISTIIKNKENEGYSAVGASGLVSAFVFMHIFFQPMQKIYFYFAIPIPGIVFGILYLFYSSYMSKRKKDNINHDAHIWGAIIGFFYPLIMEPSLIHFFWRILSLNDLTMNKAIFLDRDGVINNPKKNYYVYKIKDFSFNKGLIEALQVLQDKDYMLIVITNQGGISRGVYTKEDVDILHTYMEQELINHNIYLSNIYYCPHHTKMKIAYVEKPKPLMLEKAMAEYDIDPEQSWFIGDKKTDVEAGQNAGLNTIRIRKNQDLRKVLKDIN